jgi:hypothetical protein
VHRLEAGSQFAILRKKKERKKLKQGENNFFFKGCFSSYRDYQSEKCRFDKQFV